MNDKELLELAAKAAGIEGQYWSSEISIHCGIAPVGGLRYWNPLTDDGDVARLEAKCEIDVAWTDISVWSNYHEEFFADYGGDKNKARRYSSTKAAAKIGKEMQ